MSNDDPIDFGVLLNVAFNAFKHALERDLAAAGFDDLGPSFGYVFRLLSASPCSLSELARQLEITTPGALKLIDDMVDKGYVARTADTVDKRVKRLSLTPRGRAALKQARGFHARCERTLTEQFGARPLASTRRVLNALATAGDATGTRRPRPA